MGKSSAEKLKIGVFFIILLTVIVIAAGIIRKSLAHKRAERFTESLMINTDFEVPSSLNTKEEGLIIIWKLAEWENTTKDVINDGYGQITDDCLTPVQGEDLRGYERKEDLDNYMKLLQWRMQREKLDQEIQVSIEEIFERDKALSPISQEDVLTCYQKGYFADVIRTMKKMETGNFDGAYKIAENIMNWDGGTVAMDIAIGLHPEEMMAACEKYLTEMAKEKPYLLFIYVGHAEKIEERYGNKVEGLKNARRKVKQDDFNSKPEIPKVGMSTSQARSTKLGSPTRVTKQESSWSHKRHAYGDMIWEKNEVSIFRAHYLDNEITEVYDMRNNMPRTSYRSPSGGTYSGSFSSKKNSFDPDAHDIEAYYEDNWDEYDDYDDAYDGFLDDESAWDDY